MSGFFQNLLKGATEGFFGTPFVRDYTHASKTFTPNSYQNAPKFKFLFHTYFDINQEIYNAGFDNRQNLGLLVKEIKLPNYTFDTSVLNQYNRKRIVQTKIKYNPITITFHDDNANQATKLWEAYYRYNYRDATSASTPTVNDALADQFLGQSGSLRSLNARDTYNPTGNDTAWGYSGDAYSNRTVKVPFFNTIKIYGMNQHNFTLYTLVNPVITAFDHDTYSYNEGNGIMQNTMTIEYETVLYDYGSIDGTQPDNIVTGFGREENYDRRLSPIIIPGANNKILGRGGLLDGVGGTLESLGTGNVLGAVISAGTTYNTFKNVDLKQTAKLELLNGVNTVLTDPEKTRNLLASLPKIGTTPGPTNTAGTPVTGADDLAITTRPTRLAGTQLNSSGNATSFAAIDTAAGITRTPLP
jgi:hypothetical protein